MKVWFHLSCMFESLSRARATTKKIESPADLEGFSDINDEDKEEIKKLIKGIVSINKIANILTILKDLCQANPSLQVNLQVQVLQRRVKLQ